MPYSDNSAFEVVAEGVPKAGAYPTVSLIPYNRLVVVVDAQGCTGTLSFEGSIDGTTWFDLALTRMGDLARKYDFTLALGQLTKPVALSMMLQDRLDRLPAGGLRRRGHRGHAHDQGAQGEQLMPVIQGGSIMEGSVGRALPVSGVPGAGTNEVQTLTFGGTPTGGTFKLSFEGLTTAAITWVNVNATLVANIDAALEALASIGTGNVTTAVGTMTAGIGTITVTFAGALARKAVATMAVANNSMTGTAPTLAVAETTPGVDAGYRGAATGSMLVNTATGIVYVNTSTTAGSPTWTVIGAQV